MAWQKKKMRFDCWRYFLLSTSSFKGTWAEIMLSCITEPQEMGIQEFKGSIFKSVWTKLLAACVEDFFFPFSRRRLERASEQTSSLGRWAKTGEKRVGVSKNGGDLEGRRTGEERDDSFFYPLPTLPLLQIFHSHSQFLSLRALLELNVCYSK